MRDRATKFNDNPTSEDAWWDELELFEYDEEDLDITKCADLADELVAHKLWAETDVNFQHSLERWNWFILERTIWLPLEQCCCQGVLLPREQIALRLKTCPKKLRDSLNYLFGHCPTHVKHHLALQYWLWMRIERVKRSGTPEWRPDKPPPRDPYHDTVFFRPPRLLTRNYGR
jgi:hypothetical protein